MVNVEPKMSNNNDFINWAIDHEWFLLKTAYCDALMIDYWVCPNGAEFYVWYNDDSIIIEWKDQEGLKKG